jgi:hypothetical protein
MATNYGQCCGTLSTERTMTTMAIVGLDLPGLLPPLVAQTEQVVI